MDFTLSDEQTMVRDTARALFARECGIEQVRRAWDDPTTGRVLYAEHLAEWVALAEGDLVDVVLFAEEHGRAAAPGPFFATLLAAQVAAAAGVALAGSASVAVSGVEGDWAPHDDAQKHFVPSAGDVDDIVVVSGSLDSPRLCVVPTTAVRVTPVDQLDGLRPQYHVDTTGVEPGQPFDADAWRHATERALVTCAGELVGVGRWLLDASVAYAKEREQFDRPIGSFQGLQWELVDAALDLERATALVAYAAMCVDADDADRTRAVHAAKAEAGLAARRCATTGLQVHGGVGFTWEHGLHYWLRRAYAGDAFMGPASLHHQRVEALLFDA